MRVWRNELRLRHAAVCRGCKAWHADTSAMTNYSLHAVLARCICLQNGINSEQTEKVNLVFKWIMKFGADHLIFLEIVLAVGAGKPAYQQIWQRYAAVVAIAFSSVWVTNVKLFQWHDLWPGWRQWAGQLWGVFRSSKRTADLWLRQDYPVSDDQREAPWW